jgi:hypothetical protein
VVYLSAGGDLELRTRWFYNGTWNKDTLSLYRFRPLKSKTLRPVLGYIALDGLRLENCPWAMPYPTLYWTRSVDPECRSVTIGDLSLVDYNIIP